MTQLYLEAFVCLENNIFNPDLVIKTKIKKKSIDLYQNSTDFSVKIEKEMKKIIFKSIGENGTLPSEFLVHYYVDNTMYLDFVAIRGNLSKNTSQEVDFTLYQLKERIRITILEELARKCQRNKGNIQEKRGETDVET